LTVHAAITINPRFNDVLNPFVIEMIVLSEDEVRFMLNSLKYRKLEWRIVKQATAKKAQTDDRFDLRVYSLSRPETILMIFNKMLQVLLFISDIL
jgi:hypothetical protein